jgi:hypothetical protein
MLVLKGTVVPSFKGPVACYIGEKNLHKAITEFVTYTIGVLHHTSRMSVRCYGLISILYISFMARRVLLLRISFYGTK